MSHWFHRNVLKATTVVNFEKIFSSKDINSTKLCRDLKQSRDRLLELLPDPTNEMEVVNTAFLAYLSLINGLVLPLEGQSNKNLRHSVLFKWTHSLLGHSTQSQQDAVFEMANMSINVAFWLMKHSGYVAAKDDISMEQAKDVHSGLRKAAGLIKFIEKELLTKLEGDVRPGSDIDPKVVSAYFHQCTAEAQEVTVARAIEMKHNPSLISALANETSKLFQEAAKHLAPLDKKTSEQWILYLNIKSYIYLAYAYSYCGQNLLSLDKCGEAISALRESQKYYNKSLELCKPYSKTNGPAKPVKPDGHPFFRKLAPIVKITLEKCERENGFIYHQKVPDIPPELEMKATYGLVSPEEMQLPPLAPLWSCITVDAVASFGSKDAQISKAASRVEGDLPPVKEVTAPISGKTPRNESGCIVQ